MILILGMGMLGQALSHQYHQHPNHVISLSKEKLDITHHLSVLRVLKTIQPSLVINCAALTNVDECEKSPEKAYAIHSSAVQFLAESCKKLKIKLFHISTDYVFDGNKKTPYLETDALNPLQVYGQSKLMGEQASLKEGAFVFRIQSVYGPGKKNTTHWMVESFLNEKKIPLLTHQITSPCSSFWLARQIQLIGHRLDQPGIYHLTHDDFASRYEIGKFLCEGLKQDPEKLIEPMDQDDLRAPRPHYCVLDNHKLKEAIQIPKISGLGSWKDDLIQYMRRVYQMPFYEKQK